MIDFASWLAEENESADGSAAGCGAAGSVAIGLVRLLRRRRERLIRSGRAAVATQERGGRVELRAELRHAASRSLGSLRDRDPRRIELAAVRRVRGGDAQIAPVDVFPGLVLDVFADLPDEFPGGRKGALQIVCQ
jgi:hypothetical protein